MSNNFIFNNLGTNLEIEIDDDNQAQCPECKCKFKRLLTHLKFSKACNRNIDFENFTIEYQSFINRRKKTEYRKRKREDNEEEMLRTEARRKREQKARNLENDTVGT